MTIQGNRVTVSAAEVQEFKRSWPDSNLLDVAVWFDFARAGKGQPVLMIQMSEDNDPDECGEALLYMSYMAQTYYELERK